MIALILILLAVIYSLIMLPKIIYFVEKNGTVKVNYRGIHVYSPAGVVFAIYIIMECMLLMLYSSVSADMYNLKIYTLSVLAGSLSASFAGLLDDMTGDESKGFNGHGTMFLKGIYTSGIIKALVCILIAFTICLSWGCKTTELLLNTFLICLMQNFINLMDLRPGRAVKAYSGLFFICLLFAGIKPVFLWINTGVIVMLFFYLHYELTECCMMGDTGSNNLGIVLGITAVSSNSILFKYIILTFLISANVYSERLSINRLIERVSLLRFIDMIGRRKID